MKHFTRRVFLGGAALAVSLACLQLFLAPQTEAAINPQISFQGKITNPDGTNITNGSYSIRFRLYTSPALDGANACVANSCQWEETKSVTITDGIFQTALGDTTALPGSVDFNSSALYLGIKVTTDLEMTPRIRFTASPYAFNAERFNGQLATAYAQLSENNTFTGTNTFQNTSTTALNVQNAGSLSVLTADTSGLKVQVGSVTTDANAVELVLDSFNQAADPTGVNGAMYYNTSTNKFRCFEASAWKNCITKELATRSFVDTTADAVLDANTTTYWDVAAENNSTVPNITLTTTAKSVWGIATIETQSTGTADVEVTARIERGIGAAPTCGSGTPVGGQPGTFASNTNARKTSTTQFIDSPATISQVFYTVCSDLDTVGTTANITRIRVTLFELDNTN